MFYILIQIYIINTIVPLVDTFDPTVKLIIERTLGHIVVDIHGEGQRFNVLGLLEFDSDRKRMSVILGYNDIFYETFCQTGRY